MRVLISLVGEQPAPNLIPIYDALVKGEPFDSVHFMVSEKTKKIAENLRDTLKEEKLNIGICFDHLDPWDLAKAKNQCQEIIHKLSHDKDASITVNLTGGTKIMSLAAYQAAVNKEVPMIYVNTEHGEIILFNPQGTLHHRRSFKVKIPTVIQLRAVGRELDGYLDPKKILDKDKKLVKWIAENYAVAYDNTLRKILEEVKKRPKRQPDQYPFDVQINPLGESGISAIKRFEEAGYWAWNQEQKLISIPNKKAWTFLNGDWVEIYVVTALDGSAGFDEVLGKVRVKGIDGELDAAVTYNGRLCIVECKTTGKMCESGLTDMAAKLRAHEMIWGGPYATSIFVRAAKRDENVQKAAREYGIKEEHVINGPDLYRLAQIVAKALGLP